jgi:hypothetical protein
VGNLEGAPLMARLARNTEPLDLAAEAVGVVLDAES